MNGPGLLPVNGVGAVNLRGEAALFVEPLPADLRPTRVRLAGNRLTVMSGEAVCSVRAYPEQIAEAAAARGSVVVAELDVETRKALRATDVAVERE